MTEPIDEMVDGAGALRPSWRNLIEPVLALGGDLLAERARLLQRAAAEEGAAGTTDDAAAWSCDPIPLPLGAREFETVTRGLVQRATLIERALQDLYGPQTLVESGTYPAALVFRSRNFIRASRIDGRAAPRRMLHLYAADLVRAPDGRWHVVADRCAKPGGIALALENRRLLRRVMPELFTRDIEGLAGFFESWRESLRSLAAGDGGAGVALITDGAGDAAFAEYVLLARELGCHLVRGADLTLRGGLLYVKTLRGLARVDVLINRQSPHLLDPLELDWDNGAGVPGLMSACRAGRVTVLNDPGAGLAEDPGFAAHIPGLARRLLDEELALPQPAQLWLGDAEARAAALAAPEQFEFLASRSCVPSPVAGAALSARGLARLRSEIVARPDALVARRPVAGSVAPAVGAGRLEPRRLVLRLFLVRDGEEWVALPGGLARIAAEGERIAAELPGRGIAKDVLVMAEPDAARASWTQTRLPLRPRARRVEIRRIEGDLPARVAEAFFRLGRDLERLEMRARRVRALGQRLARFGHRPRELVELRILATSLRPTALLPEEVLIDPAAPGLERAVAHLAEPSSLLAGEVTSFGRQIELVSDRITGEMRFILMQGLADVRAAFAETRAGGSLDAVAHVTGRILGLTAILSGLASETMVRGGGWMFLEIGLRLARAETIAVLLAASFGPAATLPRHPLRGGAGPDLDAALRLVLELRDSAITYRTRYGTELDSAAVLDLVVADVSNPRSLCHQLGAVRAQLERLADVGGPELVAAAATLDAEAQAIVDTIARASDPEREMARVPDRVVPFLEGLGGFRRAITRRYLELLPEMRTLAS